MPHLSNCPSHCGVAGPGGLGRPSPYAHRSFRRQQNQRRSPRLVRGLPAAGTGISNRVPDAASSRYQHESDRSEYEWMLGGRALVVILATPTLTSGNGSAGRGAGACSRGSRLHSVLPSASASFLISWAIELSARHRHRRLRHRQRDGHCDVVGSQCRGIDSRALGRVGGMAHARPNHTPIHARFRVPGHLQRAGFLLSYYRVARKQTHSDTDFTRHQFL